MNTFQDQQILQNRFLIICRSIIHNACPDVTETIKLGMPFFEYGGSILCSMASQAALCLYLLAWLSFKRPYKILAGVGERTSMDIWINKNASGFTLG